jgi:hypothetical protein
VKPCWEEHKKSKKGWLWKNRKELGLAGGFADPRPTTETHGWVSLAVGLDKLVPDVLGTVALDDEDNDVDGSDPNNDCGRFAIIETLKDLRIFVVQHLGLFFGFFWWVCSDLGLVFSLVFNMAPAILGWKHPKKD